MRTPMIYQHDRASHPSGAVWDGTGTTLVSLHPLPGVKSAGLAADPLLFPQLCTPHEFCRVVHGVRRWAVTCTGHVPAGPDNSEHNWNVSFEFHEGLSNGDIVADEIEREERTTDEGGLSMGFYVPLASIAGTYTIDGAPSSQHLVLANGANLYLCRYDQNTSSDNTFDKTTRYFVDPDALELLYRVEFNLGSAFGFDSSTQNYPLGAGQASVNTEFTGSFNGHSLTLYSSRTGALGNVPDAFTLTITPLLWWEQRRTAGTEPIWDANTGAELQDYATLVL